MSTPINNIKNWFKTGLKPTQEQFWAWMDSYWHKAEKIPLSSIDGIDTALENKADAQQLAGKADLISGKVPLSQLPFGDDVLHYDTFSAFPPIGEVGKFYIDTAEDSSYIWDNEVQSYKSAGSDEKWRALIELYLSEKLDKPTSEGSTMTHPYVLLLDACGSPVFYTADGLGKNIGNTNLKVPVGTIRELDVEGALFKMKGLTDKSADASFNRMRVQDGNGIEAWSNGKQLITSMPNILSESEKKAWKTSMNGGFTTNTMSVFAVLPLLISNNNNNTYITLFGANLNLNPSNFSVKILSKQNLSVVASVPSSQVQLDQKGISLTFYYDFSSIPIGEYIVQIDNGVALYNTTTSFKIVNAVNKIDISGNAWVTDKRIITGVNQNIETTNNSILYDGGSTVGAISYTIASAASSAIFNTDDDFYLEISTSVSYDDWGVMNIIGLSSSQGMIDDMFIKFVTSRNNVSYPGSNPISGTISVKIIIVKQGNSFSYAIIGSGSSTGGVVSTTLLPNTPIYIKFLGSGFNSGVKRTVSIINLYKLN